MQIKEKLEVFRKFTIDVANSESNTLIREYEEACERETEEFRKNRQIEMEHKFQMEETAIRRELNRKVSEEVVRQKQLLDRCKREWEEKLFEKVKDRLKKYQQTEDYNKYLIAKIAMAKEVAGEEEVTVYINPSDVDKKEMLEEKTGVEVTVSTMEFGGGIRAVIRSRNILIDESFMTKLEQEETFL
ncbi:hypothetical protein E5329_01405 [Petralouisia muris]|jgi:vacuolar-type H+-ATPase subunit E/Vma4|uniref:Uncharacterized protein n=1 Tax=Petralouisia muris TaxID=3032872 RepID=A0AC61S0U5_9FIRM|nr:hypothetical protein [Petralouisia muris]TGY98092.1 hypothetical protein E5329_01405 [Petralouisia muris]